MTVGVVSRVYQYSTSYESAIFGATVSDSELNSLMQEYGVIQTGDNYTDLMALYNAMYGGAKTAVEALAAEKQQKDQPITTNTTNVPWESLMSQVGLRTTGDVTVDYSAFNKQLSLMQGAARSKQDEADIATLAAQASVVFNQQTQQNDITASGNSKPQSISGADIVAQLNKMFI